MPRVNHGVAAGGPEGNSFDRERLEPELEPEIQDFAHRAPGIGFGQKPSVVQLHRPRKPSKSFLENPRRWPAMFFSMFLCVLLLLAVAFFCAFLYLILKELRTERVLREDGTEVSLLGFWSVLVLSVLAGLSCCSFSWTLTYFDSYEPGMFPPTPLSPAHLRRWTGHSFHMGYSVAVLNGVAAAITVIWSLT